MVSEASIGTRSAWNQRSWADHVQEGARMKGKGQVAGEDPSPTEAGGPAHPDLWEAAVTPSSLE